MDLLRQDEFIAGPDLARGLRQKFWFRKSFRNCLATLERKHSFAIEIDDEALDRVFRGWLPVIEHKKHLAARDRADFILFAGGLVLKGLIAARPVTARPGRAVPGGGGAETDIAGFWPEGFIYTNFCISAVNAVHEQEFGRTIPLAQAVDDLRIWWSFRENVRELPAYAVAALDLFFDVEPNWAMPDCPEMRLRMRRALAN
ncbi:hypothetical protein ABE438_18840 [Bosea sp. TWI1241]|uniref:hypothetical protein n=1 Tax=Bosea sp. TWI1241 TaxID=3148904 RepID=UPI003208CF14